MSDNLPSNTPYLIVGLGNPGPKYAGTRHNAGFMVVDALVRRNGLRFSGKQANADVAKGEIAGERVIIAKPLTFMNNSGRAVASLAHFYKIPHARVLVVCDDIALRLGVLRIREKGSAGGHNGITSIIQHLGTQGFPRLRVGVDRPVVVQHSQIDWVLGHFSKDEQKVMDEAVPRAVEAVEAILREGMERAMNIYNTRDSDGDGNGDSRTKDERRTTKVSTQPSERATTSSQGVETPTPKVEPRVNSWVAKLRSIYGKEEEGE